MSIMCKKIYGKLNKLYCVGACKLRLTPTINKINEAEKSFGPLLSNILANARKYLQWITYSCHISYVRHV